MTKRNANRSSNQAGFVSCFAPTRKSKYCYEPVIVIAIFIVSASDSVGDGAEVTFLAYGNHLNV